jgi:fatty acid desaturase
VRQEAAVQGTLLAAAIYPDNTPHGYNLTFAFPMLMFIIIAGALFLRFRGAHNVPGHVSFTSSRWAKAAEGTALAAEPARGASVDDADEARHADEGTEES